MSYYPARGTNCDDDDDDAEGEAQEASREEKSRSHCRQAEKLASDVVGGKLYLCCESKKGERGNGSSKRHGMFSEPAKSQRLISLQPPTPTQNCFRLRPGTFAFFAALRTASTARQHTKQKTITICYTHCITCEGQGPVRWTMIMNASDALAAAATGTFSRAFVLLHCLPNHIGSFFLFGFEREPHRLHCILPG